MIWRKGLKIIHSWLVKPLAYLLLLAVLLVGTVAALLLTEKGNVWLVHRAAAWLPGELQIEGWHGDVVRGLALDRFSYVQGDLAIQVSDLVWQPDLPHWGYGRFQFHQLSANHVSLALPPSESKESAPFVMPESIALPIAVGAALLAVNQLTIEGETPLTLGPLEASDVFAWRHARVGRLAFTFNDTQLYASLNGSLSFPYDLDGMVHWQHSLPEGEKLKGELDVAGNLNRLDIIHELLLPMRVTSRGQVHYQEQSDFLAAWAFDLTHEWRSQALPLSTPLPLTLGKGKLQTQGTVLSAVLKGQSELVVDEQSLSLALEAQANGQGIVLTQLSLQTGKQSLALTGKVSYDQDVTWQLAAEGKHLDPVLFLADWHGDLALQLNSEGQWLGGNRVVFSATPLRISGQLNERAFSLAAVASPDKNQRTQLDAELQWGQDVATAAGWFGRQLDLQGKLQLSEMRAWLPDASGNLELGWQLQGTLEQPMISGELKAEHLAWQDWQLEQLQLEASQLSLTEQPMSLAVQGQLLSYQNQPLLDVLTLALEGRLAEHELAISLEREEAQIQLLAMATLTDKTLWQGDITRWSLSQVEAGQWDLASPTSFSVSPTQQQLEMLCLLAQAYEGEVCLQGSHHQGKVSSLIEVNRLPLAIVNPWLGEQLSLTGDLQAKADLKGEVNNLAANWHLALQGAAVIVGNDSELFEFVLDEAALAGELKQQRVKNNLNLVIQDKGDVQLALETGLAMQDPIAGRLALSLPDLSVYAPFVPWLEAPQGSLQGELALVGSLEKPGADGQLVLEKGGFTLPEWGVTLADTTLRVVGEPEQIRLQGEAKVGGGPLTFEGEWRPQQSPLAFGLTAKGKRLKVADRDDATIYISPDLQLTGDGKEVQLTGLLHVPEVRLEPRELPESAITVSDDLVIIDAENQTEGSLPFGMSVNVTLGDKVNFKGFGLTARLNGDLDVRQKPFQPTQLYGELTIVEGRFKAYGQNLAVDNGRLIFQGPAENPGINIRAIRKIPHENLVVGVLVGGTLQQPLAEIFAEPALEESEAMSYLLTGRGLNSGNDSDHAKIARALAVYGLQKGEGVGQKLGDSLGIDEITIGSEWGDADDAALMLSKQLSDRLFLTYAVGLFDAVSTVMFRYILSRTLHLEAQTSGQSQAIDLIWTKELQ